MDVETHNPPKLKTQAWISAMRLRTLPLALASTITGAFLAKHDGQFQWPIMILTALTTALLQVNSNLANDYGDFQHGTDNETRIGPERALQSGAIKPAEMRRAIVFFSVLSFLSGLLLVWLAPVGAVAKSLLMAAGVLAIYASVRYTAGKNPYGYRGLGDVSVMVFFGLLGVVGAYYVQTGFLNGWIFLPAITIGSLSAGVLNINNTRDLNSDRASGKITLAVKLGAAGARKYHVVLTAIAIDCMLIFGWYRLNEWADWLFLIAIIPIILIAIKVYQNRDPQALDPELKKLALSTFLLAVLLAVGISI